MVVKAFHAHTHNVQESQYYAADSVGLMRENQVTGSSDFFCSGETSVMELLQ